jgi:1,4-alpha-glucan branching enzyme
MPQSALLVKASDAQALAQGHHGDPFAVLGPHPGAGETIIRTFQPQAERVFVLTDQGAVEMKRVHQAGLFAARLPPGLGAYRLRIEAGDSGHEIDDPYRFPPILGELDIHLIREGTHLRLDEKLGAHPCRNEGVEGVQFAVWAPNAERVSVVGDFNGWDGRCHSMRLRHDAGVWELFIPGLESGTLYKYEIMAHGGILLPLKADPCGEWAEVPPRTASRVCPPDTRPWVDQAWMEGRARRNERGAPISIYEVHLGSWRRVPEDGNRPLTYLELADQLVAYVVEMGFTHVELMPVHEHPFGGSWGYQPVGLFAPTARYGTPDEFRALIERLHQAGIGVIIDWVAGHFPSDPHGLHWFDGTHLYEHQDPRLGVHRDWNTLIYNYGRTEVLNYLCANALYWLEHFHVDGLRVDAVASMLYLDYSREAGEWLPNRFGGNENLEAIDFLRRMNQMVYGEHPGTMTIAEESTAWPMVSRPVHLGGLGFGFKWNMGWMHDTLSYFSKEPIHRRYHHDQLTFAQLYAYHENFVLPLSHDEVVHGKGSILGRMPGDDWQRFANLRSYYAFMWTQPGKKLLFMGGEFGQPSEWNVDASLEWHVLDNPLHDGVRRLVRDLNRLYRSEAALHQLDCDARGFAWIDCNDRDNSVLTWIRFATDPNDFVVVACNFTPVVRDHYRVGVPEPGFYHEILNSDSEWYGGGNIHNHGGVEAEDQRWHGHRWSLPLTLPPLSTVVFKRERA